MLTAVPESMFFFGVMFFANKLYTIKNSKKVMMVKMMRMMMMMMMISGNKSPRNNRGRKHSIAMVLYS